MHKLHHEHVHNKYFRDKQQILQKENENNNDSL